jgi:hypothetical protein
VKYDNVMISSLDRRMSWLVEEDEQEQAGFAW